MFGDNSIKDQRLGSTDIGKAVRVPQRTIMALASHETLFNIIVVAKSIASEDENNLTIGLVVMETYRTAWLKPTSHYLVCSVVKRAEHRLSFPTLELGI